MNKSVGDCSADSITNHSKQTKITDVKTDAEQFTRLHSLHSC